jgi:pimeloyl-ACP methyl ester carboxylesterase
VRALRLPAVAIGLVLAVAACSQAGDPASSPRGTVPSISTGASPSAVASPVEPLPTPDEDFLLAQSVPVHFPAADGVRLAGRVFGSGDTGVVLSHMLDTDQQPWWWMASLLADHGYTVLTYDRRGVCPGGPAGCSEGPDDPGGVDLDIRGAIRYLRSRGATKVLIGGASLGGAASLWVASKHPGDVDGVFTLSAVPFFPPFDITAPVIRAIRAPKLLVAGERDASAGPAVPEWKAASTPPVRAVVLPTATHGTDLFDDPEYSAQVRSEILSFVQGVALA